jgi:GNAT superfamily N-acetyltransferase
MKQIIELKKAKNFEELYTLWNEEYGMIYPITKELWLFNLSNSYDPATLVCVVDDEVVGFIIGKVWKDDFKISAYLDQSWVSLIFVKKAFRHQGIGKELITRVSNEFKSLGKTTMNLGRDYHPFFPGLPTDLKSSRISLEKLGFNFSSDTFDVIKNKNYGLLPLKSKGYIYRFGKPTDRAGLLDFLNRNWPGRWTKEAMDYFEQGGTGREYLLCLDGNQVIGFAKVNFPDTPVKLISYNKTWSARFSALAGIGPLGVDKDYRGKEIGYDLVAKATNELNNPEVSDIIIDWTGLLDFYRLMGYEVWKSYYYADKKIF